MDDTDFTIMTGAETRRALTNGDIQSEVAYQNDINRLLATLEELFETPPSS
jgi:hypothetical protein